MSATANDSEGLNRRAAASIAGGVVSLNRKVDPAIVFVRAQGSRIWDAEGKEYIDYHAAFAPHLLGHNHPEVTRAIHQALDEAWSLMGSGTTAWEVRFAESVRAAVPSLEKIQITNTGSEATALAIRLARAFTDRQDIVLMLGGYNGWHNDVVRAVAPALDALGPRVCPGEYPFVSMSAGVPDGVKRHLHIVNYNDADSVEYVMRRFPIACVLTEPVLQNIGVVLPLPGYLQALRSVCDKYGAVLIFDEVKTGFRSALGGYQSICGVKPDLSVFGKAIANGYPLGVIGGREDIMHLFDHPDAQKRVLIAGTYNAHPLPVAAAIATLDILRRDKGEVYQRLESLSARFESGVNTIVRESGRKAKLSRNGSAHCLYFADHVPVDLHDLLSSHDFQLDTRYRRALIERGIYNFPLATKQGSISASHTEADIDKTLEAIRAVFKSL